VCNYLLRLCWAHGDDEIIPAQKAIEWFDLGGVGKSPARFDFAKLNNVNAHYIKERSDADLAKLAVPFISTLLERSLTPAEIDLLTKAMPDLKPRAQTLIEIAEMTKFYFHSGAFTFDDKAKKILTPEALQHLKNLTAQMENLPDFTAEALENIFRAYAEEKGLKLGAVAQPLRVALSGSTVSPPIFHVAGLLGKSETLKRIHAVL
jgi:glutamyl-tRNA synthetase